MTMHRFAADENFNNDIVRGLLRRAPDLDIVRIQDVALSGVDDATVVEWCAKEAGFSLRQDVTTITRFTYDRVSNRQGHAGRIRGRS